MSKIEHYMSDTATINQSAETMRKASACLDRQAPLKFGEHVGFLDTLRRRVDEYFATTGKPTRNCTQMYIKTAIILTWSFSSYVLLVTWASTWWQAVPLALSLGFATAAVGFNIMHDGSHGAYSTHPFINNLMARTLDIHGGSSFIWKQKHNMIHHSFTNITGHDQDIELGGLGRLSPHNRRLPFHRFQHFYLWILYGVVSLKWQFYDDFRDVFRGRIGPYHFKLKAKDWITFLCGKTVFFSLALVIPTLLHPFGTVVLFYVIATFLQGIVLSVVFQLAHCVEEADFPMPNESEGRIDNAWAVHQVSTTVDFARRNPIVTWYVGGLNYQIEHHLFPRICHVNYPAISSLVEETCREFGVNFSAHETFFGATASHFRFLRQMGRPNPVI